MFGFGQPDVLKGLRFPEEIWASSKTPDSERINAWLRDLSVVLSPVRVRNDVVSGEQATDMIVAWLTAESDSLGREFVSSQAGKHYDIGVCRSEAADALRFDFRLRTAGLPGATCYGSAVRRIGEDRFAIDVCD